MKTFIDDLLGLFYPHVCLICGNSLAGNERILCSGCNYHLPRTRFHDDPENPVARSFWGRVNLVSATAFLYFRRGGMTQTLLHNLKYKGVKDIGIYLGEEFGRELLKTETFSNVDGVIPIPLHPKKHRKRGYNQSEVIARGICSVTGAELMLKMVARKVHSSTQTRKGRFERWQNVENIFAVEKKASLSGRRILVVDDVITTGATMEACLQALSAAGNVSLYAGAVAFSSR